MHDDEIKVVAEELAAARAGKPKRPGATRKRIIYTKESIRRAVRLYRQSSQTLSVFARQLGISATALGRWAADNEGSSVFIPVRAINAPTLAIDAKSSDVAPVATAAKTSSTAMVVVRETVVSIPVDLDLGLVREIMAALHGGASC
jgi:hypothetical protein